MAGGITKRRRADERISYRAQIRIRRGGVSHSEWATFNKQALAVAWRHKRLAELEQPGALDAETVAPESLGDLIDWYIPEDRDVLRWGRNKQKTLEQLGRHSIVAGRAVALTSADLVDFVRGRRAEGAGPATMDGALTWIGVVLKTAQSHDCRVDAVVVDDAKRACRRTGLIGSSRKRARRPTPAELERLYAEFDRLPLKTSVPMAEIVRFAVASSRRRNGILSLR